MADSNRIHESFTIMQSPDELYRFWRNLSNLPRFMRNVRSVEERDGNRSHWVVGGPGDRTYEWDAEIVRDEPGQVISWRTVEDADVQHSGVVTFRPATGDRGTVVEVDIAYDPPGGAAGAALARLFGTRPKEDVREDLRRFKQLVETGEIPTIRGQSAARDTDDDDEDENLPQALGAAEGEAGGRGGEDREHERDREHEEVAR
jgi:uncharacterized membrane protein